VNASVKIFFDAAVRPLVHQFSQRFNLSKRETQASLLLCEGMRAKEIAHYMSCSEKTVYAHLARVCKKTHCRDYHEVVCMLLAFVCHVFCDKQSDASAPRAPFQDRATERQSDGRYETASSDG